VNLLIKEENGETDDSFHVVAKNDAGDPVLEQSSYSDLIDKYYLDIDLSCDVSGL
jgi:hypothetical protein